MNPTPIIDLDAGKPIGPHPEGVEYPLVEPSDDIAGLLADVHLAHDKQDIKHPLKIKWISGLDLPMTQEWAEDSLSTSGLNIERIVVRGKDDVDPELWPHIHFDYFSEGFSFVMPPPIQDSQNTLDSFTLRIELMLFEQLLSTDILIGPSQKLRFIPSQTQKWISVVASSLTEEELDSLAETGVYIRLALNDSQPGIEIDYWKVNISQLDITPPGDFDQKRFRTIESARAATPWAWLTPANRYMLPDGAKSLCIRHPNPGYTPYVFIREIDELGVVSKAYRVKFLIDGAKTILMDFRTFEIATADGSMLDVATDNGYSLKVVEDVTLPNAFPSLPFVTTSTIAAGSQLLTSLTTASAPAGRRRFLLRAGDHVLSDDITPMNAANLHFTTIEGETGDPEDVVIRGTTTSKGRWYVNNSATVPAGQELVIKNVTLTGLGNAVMARSAADQETGFLVFGDGHYRLENCIIKGCSNGDAVVAFASDLGECLVELIDCTIIDHAGRAVRVTRRFESINDSIADYDMNCIVEMTGCLIDDIGGGPYGATSNREIISVEHEARLVDYGSVIRDFKNSAQGRFAVRTSAAGLQGVVNLYYSTIAPTVGYTTHDYAVEQVRMCASTHLEVTEPIRCDVFFALNTLFQIGTEICECSVDFFIPSPTGTCVFSGNTVRSRDLANPGPICSNTTSRVILHSGCIYYGGGAGSVSINVTTDPHVMIVDHITNWRSGIPIFVEGNLPAFLFVGNSVLFPYGDSGGTWLDGTDFPTGNQPVLYNNLRLGSESVFWTSDTQNSRNAASAGGLSEGFSPLPDELTSDPTTRMTGWGFDTADLLNIYGSYGADGEAIMKPFYTDVGAVASSRFVSGQGLYPTSLNDDVAASSAYISFSDDPVQTHPADVLIVDADDTVVFDSTTAPDYQGVRFGNRFFIHEWLSETAVCRIVQHAAAPTLDSFRLPYPAFYPDSAVLDERTHVIEPQKLMTITAGGVTVAGDDVEFLSGYNILTQATVGDTVRAPIDITFSADAGQGEGRYPACAPVDGYVRSINRVGPDSKGNFNLRAFDCLYARPPLNISFGVATPINNTLVLGNDCVACCNCVDYVNVFKALERIYDKWKFLGQEIETLRSQYSLQVDSWNKLKACVDREPMKVSYAVSCDSMAVSVAVTICNGVDICWSGIELEISAVGGKVQSCGSVVSTNSASEVTGVTGVDQLKTTWSDINVMKQTSVTVTTRVSRNKTCDATGCNIEPTRFDVAIKTWPPNATIPKPANYSVNLVASRYNFE